tara:strand:- start:483 stop:962 length:480 start_codon:yes stop_codon:yes gene_type:complete
MQQSKKKIEKKFVDVYDSLITRLKKDKRLHYLKVKKINKGIKVGDIRIQKNNTGYILKKGFNRGFAIIEKDISHKKSAIMLAVFYNNEDKIKYQQILNTDQKFSMALEKLRFSKERMQYYTTEKDWFKVQYFESRLRTYLWSGQSALRNINTMYYNYVF